MELNTKVNNNSVVQQFNNQFMLMINSVFILRKC